MTKTNHTITAQNGKIVGQTLAVDFIGFKEKTDKAEQTASQALFTRMGQLAAQYPQVSEADWTSRIAPACRESLKKSNTIAQGSVSTFMSWLKKSFLASSNAMKADGSGVRKDRASWLPQEGETLEGHYKRMGDTLKKSGIFKGQNKGNTSKRKPRQPEGDKDAGKVTLDNASTDVLNSLTARARDELDFLSACQMVMGDDDYGHKLAHALEADDACLKHIMDWLDKREANAKKRRTA